MAKIWGDVAKNILRNKLENFRKQMIGEAEFRAEIRAEKKKEETGIPINKATIAVCGDDIEEAYRFLFSIGQK